MGSATYMETSMTQELWTEVDEYLNGLFVPQDDALDAALKAADAADMPKINVAPTQGKLLYILARSHGVRSILEIGTLAGYSTIWLARALPPDGRLTTLEIDPARAVIAKANIERAGLAEKVDIRVAPAIQTLPQLAGFAPFDLVFIDADKVSTPDYLTWALRLTKPGSLILIDNVIRKGAVSDPTTPDENVQGIQRALAMLAAEPRVVASAIQTVGSKGYDGLAIALVVEN
jgi:predicted O-methyltransferase YrrM